MQHFPDGTTAFQQVIHQSKYARFNHELGRREFWPETVDRVVTFYRDHLEGKFGVMLGDRKWEQIRNAIWNMDVFPSMRAMMTAGPALAKDNVAAFNCSYIPMIDTRAYGEMMYILMCGTGVGFSVERQYIKGLPEVPTLQARPDLVIEVEDSKIGWASSLIKLLDYLFMGYVPKWDTSKVRQKGALLMTFGGRASGPLPLEDLFHFVVETFRTAQGRRLTSVECHDLCCKVADAVVSGGVRRSALISLSNLSDNRMRDAKVGEFWNTNPQRGNANNSASYTERPEVDHFMAEWLSIFKSGTGERGIFNREGAQKKVKSLPFRDPNHEFGTNPCVTFDTRILTDKGYRKIGEIVGHNVNVWNGKRFSSVVPFSTGVNEILRLQFSDGTVINCTPYHKFFINGKFPELGEVEAHGFKANGRTKWRTRVEARRLTLGQKMAKFDMPIVHGGTDPDVDAYSQGFYSGDGCSDHDRSYVYSTKYCVIPRLSGSVSDHESGGNRRTWKHGDMLAKNFVPIDASLRYRLEWLAGVLDADGCVVSDKNADGFQIVSVDEQFLNAIRLMLSTMGVSAKVRPQKARDREASFYSKDGVPYKNQPTFVLLIGGAESCRLQSLGIAFERLQVRGTQPQRSAQQFVTLEFIDKMDPAETFCFTDLDQGAGTFEGMVTGNCGEIILRPFEFCNLCEIIIRPHDTLDSLLEKVEIAGILGTIQSSFTDFRFIRKEWQVNCEEERLLGIGLTGVFGHSTLRTVNDMAKVWLSGMRDRARHVNYSLARKMNINPSAAITCVKPSGTASKLANCENGIHPRRGRYVTIRIRSDNKDPMTQFLKDQGVSWEPEVGKEEDMTVFSFPESTDEFAATEENLSAKDHFDLIQMYNQFWADHNVSCTLKLHPHEWPGIGARVWDNWDAITGMAFLPRSGGSYIQAPQEIVDKNTHDELLAVTPQKLNWNMLTNYEGGQDHTKSSKELACVSGVCMLTEI